MNLSKKALKKCEETIKMKGRLLEQYLFDDLFNDKSPTKFLEELKKYQNEDGGFGNGLELDALVPYSAALPTTFALDYLKLVDNDEFANEIIEKAICYLEKTFDKERNGWYAFDERVNNYPHTPWWHFDEEEKMTAIDHHYGNPTAKIIAYFIRYKQFVHDFPTQKLVKDLIQYIEGVNEFVSEHELYCFINLYEELDEGENKKRLEKKIKQGIYQLIDYNTGKYKDNYVPEPLDYFELPNMNHFGIDEEYIEANLDYYVKELEKNHAVLPSWGSSFYQGDFKTSYTRWIGVNTLRKLIILKNYQRIE